MKTFRRRIYRKSKPSGPSGGAKQSAQSFFDTSSEPSFFSPSSAHQAINRKCEKCEQEEKKVQRSEKASAVKDASGNVPSYIASLDGKGAPLSDSVKKFFEPKFKADFSSVRIHDNEQAAEAASSVQAKAFTHKNHIVFNKGVYNPESSAGRELLAHELTHIVQQNSGISRMEVEKQEEEKLQRTPDMGGVFDKRYSYSTHCGWIDWGHVNPTLARNLIAIIQEAAKRMQRKEDALKKQIAMEMPAFITEDKCPASYLPSEVKDSATDSPVQSIIDTKSGATEIRLGGFEVGSFDPAKFKSELKAHAWWALNVSKIKGVPFDLKIGGLTDCVGSGERNIALRNSRASAVFIEMAKAMAGQTLIHIPVNIPLNQFFMSNSTREGRKMNRGVVLQLIPHATSEVVETPKMESSALGITLSEVTPKVSLDKTLNAQEVLQAALTTYMLQSLFFEAAQSWTDFIGGSSFAEEDLVSNIIGFYRAAEGFSKDEVMKICDVWDVAKSFEKFRNYSFQKNRTFRPLSLPPGGAWPREFSSIRPMSLNAENFSILSMFIKPSFVAPGKCQINADGTITCS